MNEITLIAIIYHWEQRLDNEIIVSIDKKINDWVRKEWMEKNNYGK